MVADEVREDFGGGGGLEGGPALRKCGLRESKFSMTPLWTMASLSDSRVGCLLALLPKKRLEVRRI